jgi:hypothetical protein
MTKLMWQFDPYVPVNGLVINGLRHVPIFLEGPVGVQMWRCGGSSDRHRPLHPMSTKAFELHIVRRAAFACEWRAPSPCVPSHSFRWLGIASADFAPRLLLLDFCSDGGVGGVVYLLLSSDSNWHVVWFALG